MQYSIILCDDNIDDLTLLKEMVERFFFPKPDYITYHIDTCTSGEALLQLCHNNLYHFVFLDIDMPRLDGIQTAKKIRQTNENIYIVFVSTYPQYMRESFEVQAFHFIEKPISFTSIEHVCEKLLKKHEKAKDTIISISSDTGEFLANVKDLVFIEVIKGSSRMLSFNLNDGSIIETSGILSSWETELKEYGFVVPTRGILINISYVRIIEGDRLILKNNTSIPLSRRYSKKIRNLFTNHVLSFLNQQ